MKIEYTPKLLLMIIFVLIICTILGFILGRLKKKEKFEKRVEDMVNSRINLMYGARTFLNIEPEKSIVDLKSEVTVRSDLPIDMVQNDLAVKLASYIIEQKLFKTYSSTQRHGPGGYNSTRHEIMVQVLMPKESNEKLPG